MMLIPTYLLVGVWGAAGTSRASLRYVLFTLVGSLLMLVAIIALWNAGGGTSLHLDTLLQVTLSPSTQFWMFIAFFVAFAVKSALVPFHTWLPDAQSAHPRGRHHAGPQGGRAIRDSPFRSFRRRRCIPRYA